MIIIIITTTTATTTTREDESRMQVASIIIASDALMHGLDEWANSPLPRQRTPSAVSLRLAPFAYAAWDMPTEL